MEHNTLMEHNTSIGFCSSYNENQRNLQILKRKEEDEPLNGKQRVGKFGWRFWLEQGLISLFHWKAWGESIIAEVWSFFSTPLGKVELGPLEVDGSMSEVLTTGWSDWNNKSKPKTVLRWTSKEIRANDTAD